MKATRLNSFKIRLENFYAICSGIFRTDLLLFIFHYFFFEIAKQSPFIPIQNVAYFISLPFLIRKVFTFYINDVLLFKFPFPEPKG